MPDRDAEKSAGSGGRVTGSRLILFAQALSVLASVTGFIGLVIVYKTLAPGSESDSSRQSPPTIL